MLILLAQGHDALEVVLTERAGGLAHVGQIAFAGGHLRAADQDDPVRAALREAQEEIGLALDGVHIVSALPAIHPPVSKEAVAPVVAWWREPVELTGSTEVAAIHDVPLSLFADSSARVTFRHPSGYTGPAFTVDDLFI
ncbi:CoA pyrophosphatase [Kribbella sp. NPDC056861]|uniref:NUDIX hydrolase n=1 Tax=Kribbella sp. NPDC056861 TaxID=3154857 RepID=UPI00344028E8